MLVWARKLAPLFGLLVFAAALALLHHMLRAIHPSQVVAGLRATPKRALLAAGVLTAASYLALAGFDGLGAAYIGKHLRTPRIVLISFVSHAVSHSAGFATLTGGAIRFRLYSAVGLSPADVAAVVAFCGLTFGLGASSLAAAALLSEPGLLAALLHLPMWLLRLIGLLLAAGVGGYVAWGAAASGPIMLFGHRYPVPPPRLAGLQILVAAGDLALASAALFVLLPEGGHGGYPAFVGAYVVANLLGLLAHVPGGLGVFDAAILVLTPAAPKEAVLGGLLLFRFFYNLLPLALAALLLLVYEAIERVPAVGRRLGGLFDELAPPLLALLAFAIGGATVIARAIPGAAGNAVGLALGAAESFAGSLLMATARGLSRRHRGARLAALLLLALLAGLVLWQDPFAPRALLEGVLVVLLALSGELPRPRPELPPPSSAPWIIAIGAVVAAALWTSWWLGGGEQGNGLRGQSALWADAAAVAAFAGIVIGAGGR